MTLGRRSILKAMAGIPVATALPTVVDALGSAARADDPPTAYIDVSVATLWVSPGRNRPVDLPSTTNPADPAAWMDAMTLAERYWLIGELETQAAYGTPVRILETSGEWSHVAVVGQPTPRNELGYPGWMPTAQLATSDSYRDHLADKSFAMVTSNTATLFTDPLCTKPDLELTFNTRLPLLSRTPNGLHVSVPAGGTRWLRLADVAVFDSVADIPYPSADELVATAMRFLGLRYLWAGVSAYGFDCSGFTSTVFGSHGITIPRDAGPQYAAGQRVTRDELRTGDLVFFAHDHGTGSIHHVGMYVDDGTIIDAPTNTTTVEGGVERVPLVEHRYIDEYAGAARYLGA